ncbi:MAG TPA: DUF6531 domain-containing protein, partial [Candidatus Binatia bacterium]|nr:DUF6531 domain-containing protein [Candidatus Binatia bacterium]
MPLIACLTAMFLLPQGAAGVCIGDCDGNGRVNVNELVVGVNIALGNADLGSCRQFDADGNERVTVDELVKGVNNALNGCAAEPTATATPTPSPTPSLLKSVTAIVHPSPTASATAGPTIAFQPMSGAPGSSVAITGKGFAGATAVAFNGAAASFTIGSGDSVTAIVPQGATSGPISVTTPQGTITSNVVFAVLHPSTFSLTAGPGAGAVIQGQSTTYAVMLESANGFAQLAALSIAGLPAGLTATLAPSQITAGQMAMLTITAPANQPTGTSMFTVSASAKVLGVSQHQSAMASVTVEPVTTSFLGRTVVADNQQTPLAGVTITFLGKDGNGNTTGCSGQQRISDAAGNFAFTNLPDACAGEQLVRYDGMTATPPPGQYAGVDLIYTIVPHQVVVSPVLIHLPRIDDKETVMVQQNAPFDQTFTFKTIPFLSVTVYAGTTLILADGTQPDPFPLTAIEVPVDRLPEEFSPQAQNPTSLLAFIVAFQPANAVASQPVAVTFPNTLNTPPGTYMQLFTLDPMRGQMVPYGSARVSDDGTQIIPNPDPAHPGHAYGLVHFDWHGPTAPPPNDVNPSPDPCGPKSSSPIDLASGIEVITATDLTINGRRGPVGVTRTYRTLSSNPGPFGIGTNHNFGYQLGFQGGGQQVALLVMPDGNQLPFNLQPDGTWINSTVPSLRGAVLSAAFDVGTFTLRWKDGTTFNFGTFFTFVPLTSISDPNGNVITLARSASNPALITQVIDPVGRALTLSYDGSNRIISIVDPIGRTVRYTYNSQGTLETVTDATGGVTRYDYDDRNRLTQITDARGIVVARNVYGEGGRVIKQTAADGGVTFFSYFSLDPNACADLSLPRAAAVRPKAGGFGLPECPFGGDNVSPLLGTIVTDPLGNTTTYRFNTEGFLVDVTDALGQKRGLGRNLGTNLVTAVTGPASCSVCGAPGAGDFFFTYDANGNMLTRTDALGHTTTYTYEPTFNKVSSVTDPLGNTTNFTYDTHGNLLSIADPLGHTTSITYDSHGLATSITDPLGNSQTLTYDDDGNLVAVTDPLGHTSSLAYDPVSRLVAQSDPRGKTTRLAYDDLDRITQTVDALGGKTQFSYDPTGNLLSVTDALNHPTAYAYDTRGRVSRRTDPLGASETFAYDVADNLTAHTDRKGQVTTYSYDALNRPTGVQYADSASHFAYDAQGRMILAGDASGDIQRTYDLAGRMTQEATSQGAIDYIYDAAGRRTSMSVVGQTPVSYSYDAASRLSEIVQGSQVVDFTYDAADRRTKLTLPNGVSTEYRYDTASRISELLYRNATSTLGNLTYQYDAAGNRTGVGGSFARTLLPDAIAASEYDAANRQ